MTTLRIERTLTCRRGGRGAPKVFRAHPEPAPAPIPTGRVPRIARLLALAHRFDRLVQTGAVADGSALARLGHVSRTRIAQILNLLNLSPSIQEEILFLPCTERGRDPIHLAQLLPIALAQTWNKNVTRNHRCASMPELMCQVRYYLRKRNRRKPRPTATATAA